MDVYIINNIISTKILCYTRGQHIMCHDIMIILCCMMTTNKEVQLLAQCYCIHITCMQQVCKLPHLFITSLHSGIKDENVYSK